MAINVNVLKSAGFWVTVIGAILGLLVSQGVVLSGTTLDQVIGYVVTLLGAYGGHSMVTSALPKAASAA
jgi:hypothetical protein